MNRKVFIVQIGYTGFAAQDQATALRLYQLITSCTPITSVYLGDGITSEGKMFSYALDSSVSLEMSMIDISKVALDLTPDELRQKYAVRETEFEGESTVVARPVIAAELAAPFEETTDFA